MIVQERGQQGEVLYLECFLQAIPHAVLSADSDSLVVNIQTHAEHNLLGARGESHETFLSDSDMCKLRAFVVRTAKTNARDGQHHDRSYCFY